MSIHLLTGLARSSCQLRKARLRRVRTARYAPSAIYAATPCVTWSYLGARGVSLLFSSGDGGVGDGNDDPETQQCFTNDGRNITRFRPLFPPSCP